MQQCEEWFQSSTYKEGVVLSRTISHSICFCSSMQFCRFPFPMEGYLFLVCFLRQVLELFWVPGSMLSCFSAFCFSCFSAFLLLCFTCFFSFLLLCLPCFSAFLLVCFCAFLLLLFYFFFSSVMCFCCSTSCSSASLLPVFTASLFFLCFCFILSCL